MAGRKRILNDRPLKMIAAILIAVMVILFIRYMASPSGGNRTPESREAVQSASVSPSVGAENAGASAEGNQGTLEAVSAVSSSSSVNASSGNSSAENASASSASSAGGTDNSAVKGDTAVLSDGNGNTVTVTYDSGVAWYDANQNVYSPLGSGNWMDESGNIYTEEGSSNNTGDTAGGGSGINLVQNRG